MPTERNPRNTRSTRKGSEWHDHLLSRPRHRQGRPYVTSRLGPLSHGSISRVESPKTSMFIGLLTGSRVKRGVLQHSLSGIANRKTALGRASVGERPRETPSSRNPMLRYADGNNDQCSCGLLWCHGFQTPATIELSRLSRLVTALSRLPNRKETPANIRLSRCHG
jgi:hypothetical protein